MENSNERSATIAGFFTASQLAEILNEISSCQGIVLFAFPKEVFYVIYKESFWIGVDLKDSNNPQAFATVDDLVAYLQKNLGSSLSISYSNLNTENQNNKNLLPASYLKLIQSETTSLLKEHGFPYIFFQPKNILDLFLQSASLNENTADALALGLVDLIKNHKRLLISDNAYPLLYATIKTIFTSRRFEDVVDAFLSREESVLSLLSITLNKPQFDQLIAIIEPACNPSNANILKSIKKLAKFARVGRNYKTQAEIIKKLTAFLNITNPSHTKKLQTALENSNGVCFGLAVCHGALDITGYLDWWESALVELLNWDEQKQSLQTEVSLPGSRAKTADEKTLSAIFNRILNYILFDHANLFNTDEDFLPKDIVQSNFLNKRNYFEVVDRQNKIRKIENSKKISGNFTKENLIDILDEKQIENSICILSTIDHAARIGYKNKTWIYYNSEGDHTSLSSIHRQFTSKSELIETILNELDSSFTIIAASLDPKKSLKFPGYDKLLQKPETAADLLKEEGLALIIEHTPETLKTILETIKNHSLGADILAHALMHEYNAHDLFGMSQQYNGLYSILYKASHLLPKVMDIVRKSSTGRDCLALALANGITFERFVIDEDVHYFRRRHDSSATPLSKAIDIIASSSKAPDALAAMLRSNETKTWYKISCLDKVLSIVAQSNKASDSLVQALNKRSNKFYEHPFVYLSYSPKCFSQVIDIIAKSPSSLKEFKKTTLATTYPRFKGIDYIAAYSPQHLSIILDETELNNYVINLLQNDEKVFEDMKRGSGDNLEKLFEVIFTILEKQKDGAEFFCSLPNSYSLLLLIAKFASSSLPTAFAFIQSQTDLGPVLTTAGENGWSVLYTMACYNPQSLSTIDKTTILQKLAHDCVHKVINVFAIMQKECPANLPKLYATLNPYFKKGLITDLENHLQNINSNNSNSFWPFGNDIAAQKSVIPKIIAQIQNQKTENFSDNEIAALNTGVLGSIISKYKPTGVVPRELSKAEDCKALKELRLLR